MFRSKSATPQPVEPPTLERPSEAVSIRRQPSANRLVILIATTLVAVGYSALA